jgi:hypothetical protein
MHLLAVRLAPVAVSLCLLVPISARAEEPQTQTSPASYDELIRRGLQEFSLGHWSEAKVFFANAHAVRPNARTLRSLGLTSYEARSYVEAIAFFEQAMSNEQQPLTKGMRDECSRLLAQARQFTSRARIEVEPANALLQIDDKPAQLGADGIALLDPGPHQILAQAPGFEPLAHSVNANGGEALNVRLRLSPIAQASDIAAAQATPFIEPPPEATSPPASSNSSDSTAQALGPWIVIAGSGAVAVAGGIFLGVAVADKSHAEHPGADPIWSDVQGATKQGRTFFPVGFALLGAGLAGVAAGFAWKYWPSSTERAGTASLTLVPGGFVVSGAL